MNSSPDLAKLQGLLDRVAIEDCLVRYCRAVDRCDAPLLRTVYWPGAIDDHIFWQGSGGGVHRLLHADTQVPRPDAAQREQLSDPY